MKETARGVMILALDPDPESDFQNCLCNGIHFGIGSSGGADGNLKAFGDIFHDKNGQKWSFKVKIPPFGAHSSFGSGYGIRSRKFRIITPPEGPRPAQPEMKL